MTFIEKFKKIVVSKYLGKTVLDYKGDPFVVKCIACDEDYDGIEISFWDRDSDLGPPVMLPDGNYKVLSPGIMSLHLRGYDEMPKTIKKA